MERRGLEPVKRVAQFEFDFARDGGAIGDIALRGDSLPDGAIVTDGKIHVSTALTSGGSATIALKLLTAVDTLAATAVASWSANAILDVVPVRTAATAIRNTANGTQLKATVAVAALTAGRFTVALEYYQAMIDGSEVIGMATLDFGSSAMVNGQPLQVIACLDGDLHLEGTEIVRSGPYALASAAAIVPLEISAGDEGDTLAIGGIDYTILAIDPDGAGMVVLTLEEQ